jgi:hypothetical protein
MECNPPGQGLYLKNMNREAALLFEENKRLKESIKAMESIIVRLKAQNTPVQVEPKVKKWDFSFLDDEE